MKNELQILKEKLLEASKKMTLAQIDNDTAVHNLDVVGDLLSTTKAKYIAGVASLGELEEVRSEHIFAQSEEIKAEKIFQIAEGLYSELYLDWRRALKGLYVGGEIIG